MAHRLSRKADAGLDDFWRYVATKSSSFEIAGRLIDSITEGSFCSQHPHLGRRSDRDLRPGLRSFPVGAYIIIYSIEGEDVLNLCVVRGSRDIVELLED
jgi:toxin ParE1/3/4